MTSRDSTFSRFNRDAKKVKGPDDPHLDLWKKWDSGGRQSKHLEPLLDSLAPTIQSHAKKIHSGVGGGIPYSSIEAKVRIAAKQGLESYTPDRGAKVRTWVIGNFQRTTDFVAKNRNFSNIPKPRFEKYQQFQNAKNEFLEMHGHEPSYEEMKVLLPDIPPRTLKPLMQEFRRDLYIGGGSDPDAEDGSMGTGPSQIRTLLSLTPALLTTEEKRVFDHLYPSDGSSGSIAQVSKKTGLSQNQIYRVRAAIYKKVKPHLENI